MTKLTKKEALKKIDEDLQKIDEITKQISVYTNADVVVAQFEDKFTDPVERELFEDIGARAYSLEGHIVVNLKKYRELVQTQRDMIENLE